jgi:hypothetical protein
MSDTPPSEGRADPARCDAPPDTSSAAEITVGTDAAYASPALVHIRGPLRNISEVRHFFRTNEVPIYFVGATPFNLLGLDRWVRNFCYVTYYDGWDGAHPRVFSPKHKPYIEFQSGGDQQLAADQSRGAGIHVAADHFARPTTQGSHGVLRRRDRADLR